jgi:hypothetical protein
MAPATQFVSNTNYYVVKMKGEIGDGGGGNGESEK